MINRTVGAMTQYSLIMTDALQNHEFSRLKWQRIPCTGYFIDQNRLYRIRVVSPVVVAPIRRGKSSGQFNFLFW